MGLDSASKAGDKLLSDMFDSFCKSRKEKEKIRLCLEFFYGGSLTSRCTTRTWIEHHSSFTSKDRISMPEAAYYFARAAEMLGGAQCLPRLGVESDSVQKRSIADCYRIAADAGVSDAQYRLGMQEKSRSATEATAWIAKAALQDHPESLFELGVLYESGSGGVAKDLDRALGLFRKSSELGYCKAVKHLKSFEKALAKKR